LLSAFLDTLDFSRLGLVLAAEVQPLAALENSWSVLSCHLPGRLHLLHPDNLVLTLDHQARDQKLVVARLLQHFDITRNPEDVFCWFSGVADPRDGDGVLVIFVRQDPIADHTRELLCAQTIRHLQLAAQLARQERQYDGWLNEVRIIKENLLPPSDHAIAGVDHAVYYRSCVGGGGDYYDVVDLRPALARNNTDTGALFVGIALCDVSGHGPGAAVEVAMLDAIVRTYRGQLREGPADVLHYLNRHFFTRHLRGAFVTGVLCHYDAASQRMLWSNAGHLPIIVLRGDGRIEVLDDSQGIPVGIDRDSRWDVHETPMQAGDAMLLMSDGITEGVSASNEQFGFERVLGLLQNAAHLSASETVQKVIAALKEHMQGSDDQDDQTLLFLRVLE